MCEDDPQSHCDGLVLFQYQVPLDAGDDVVKQSHAINRVRPGLNNRQVDRASLPSAVISAFAIGAGLPPTAVPLRGGGLAARHQKPSALPAKVCPPQLHRRPMQQTRFHHVVCRIVS
jgi:hypothetical protein